MNQGHCYKLFRENLDYTEALLKCAEQKGIIASPLTFTQSEFLESLVTYLDTSESEKAKKIWLGHRKEDLYDDSYFDDIMTGHGPDYYGAQNGDCIAMVVDSFGNHQGWKRFECSSKFNFICQTSEITNAIAISVFPAHSQSLQMKR